MQGTATSRRRARLLVAALLLTPVLLSGASGPNPFAGKRLFVDPNSDAKRQAETWRRSRPADAALIARIAEQPVAKWLGGWVRDIRREVSQMVATITGSGALPVFVAYNIPYRDCGSYSAGGSATATAYRKWIKDFAAGVGGRNAIVILEPDALPGMDCLAAAGQRERLALLREGVSELRRQRAAVYIDAGNVNWRSADVMADRLKRAGIAEANGFALNVSNFAPTQANIAYGEKISRLVGGKHFIIDTSRNGLQTTSREWCNPRGRALGVAPTTNTGHPLVDAFLWVKVPGQSDGTCGGGPQAGSWWSTYALELSRMATTLSGRTR